VLGGICDLGEQGTTCISRCDQLLCNFFWVDDGPAAGGTACGDLGNDCTADTCDGAGTCLANDLAGGTPCGDLGNDCTADACDGAGTCIPDDVAIGTACGDPSATQCTDADTCDGAGTCLPNDVSGGAPCGDLGNECTADTCDGAGTCVPEHLIGTACGSPGDVCFLAQCLAPTVVNSSSASCDDDVLDNVCETSLMNECTLCAAIQQTNETTGSEAIELPAGTLLAPAATLTIRDDLLLLGAGAGATFIDGGGNPGILEVDYPVNGPFAVAISGVSVENGGGDATAAITNHGMLTLTNSTVSGNSGGGIRNHATLALTNSTVSGNDGYPVSLPPLGAGIFNNVDSYGNGGTLTITNSTVSGNLAQYGGGGIFNAGTLSLTNSTVSGNLAVGRGGGIYNYLGALTLTNSTVSENSSVYGGGIENRGTMTLINSTLSGNGAAAGLGGGIYNRFGTLTLTNGIVADNAGGDCSHTVTDGGHNIDSDNSCGLDPQLSQPGSDPLLGPLADNGGPTLTHLPQLGSPVVDAGDNTACPPTDQRGEPRPVDGNEPLDGVADCDIGAIELPEPGQLVLLGAGIAFLLTVGRRRMKA
jgi:hypothetical protein